MLLGLTAAVWIDSNVTKATQALGTIFWWLFFGLLARLLWCLLDWSHNWFVATDKRLLLRYGLISHKVAMMPLLKVTDMSLRPLHPRPVPRLRQVRPRERRPGPGAPRGQVGAQPRPDLPRHLRRDLPHRPTPGDEDFEEIDGEFPDDTGQPGGPVPPVSPIVPGGGSTYPDVHRTHNPIQDRLDSYSRAVPIQRPSDRPETVYESDDLKRRRRGADTGPIWPRSDD